MGVDVIDGARLDAGIVHGDRRCPCRLAPVGSRLDHVVGVGRGAVAEQLRIRCRAPARGGIGVLEHEQRGALAHDEPVPTDVERTRGLPGILVVPRRQRPDDVERTERERRERDLAAAGDRGIDPALAQVAERLTDRDCARRARVGRRQDRAAHVERDAEIGRGRAAEHREGEVGRDLADALVEIARVLFLGVGDAAERRTEVDPDAIRAGGTISTGSQPRVLERELTRDQAELAEPVELAGGLRWHPRERVEVIHLGRDLAPERRRVEPIDALDRRDAGAQTGSEGVDARADRRDQSDTRDPGPPPIVHVGGFTGGA